MTCRSTRYKEVVHEEVEHRDPLDIIADLIKLSKPRYSKGSPI